MVTQQLHELRVAHLLLDVMDHQRPLGLPNQPGRRLVHRSLPKRRIRRPGRREHPEPHSIALGNMQDQVEIVEPDHPMQTLRQIFEQRGQVPVPRNRFGNIQQGAVLIYRGIDILG